MNNLEILKRRHSVRSYTQDPLSPDIVKKLKAEITMTNTHQQGIKFQLITDDPEPFKGFSKSYGIFENPRNYMAAVVDTATPHIMERAGYFAQQFVIKAVELGLGTCFVGGTYNEAVVKAQLRAGEKILFLILLGYPAGKSRKIASLMVNLVHRKKMNAAQFFIPQQEYTEALKSFPFLADGIEGIACAPSALNKRPTRVFIGEHRGQKVPCAKVDDSNLKNRIDLGIAKYNFNFATSTECDWGNGSPLILIE
ncbi:MAG: hypothetical protein HDR88_08870 [Bacteroides sp.]|nr:hypothetical protein [Bacteroides sp.]